MTRAEQSGYTENGTIRGSEIESLTRAYEQGLISKAQYDAAIDGRDKTGETAIREERTVNAIKNGNYSAQYKQKLVDTYYEFKGMGIITTQHSINRFLGQKSGRTPFSMEDVKGIMQKAPNYLQTTDGCLVRHYPPLTVVTDIITGEIVTIISDRNTLKTDWEAIK